MNLRKFTIMWRDIEVARVDIDNNKFEVWQDDEHIKKPFKKLNTEDIKRKHITEFVFQQIFDETNAAKERILKDLDLDNYDSWEIFYRTRGVSVRNNYWVKYKGDDYSYEEIRHRKLKH